MSPELARRIAFTLGALIVYRIGKYVPVPGIDPTVLSQMLGSSLPRSGRGFRVLAIFSLDIVPYVAAAVIVQLFTLIFGIRKRLDARGERGSRTIEYCVLALTGLFVIGQSFAIASGLEELPNLVSEPGWLFRISTVMTFAGGTFFLIWLSRQITLSGIGKGLALLLFVGIVAELPASIAYALEFGRRGVPESNLVLVLSALIVAVIALIVVVESARRRVPIEFASPRIAGQSIEARTSDLSLKLNNAGIIPVTVASWLLYPPLVIGSLVGGQGSWLGEIAEQFRSGRPVYIIYLAAATIILALVYTAFILDPGEIATKLKRFGGSIPGVEAGDAAAEHIDSILSRTAIFGGVYLAFICLVPEMLSAYAQLAEVPFYFGGIPALIVVSTVLDIDRQIRVETLA
jgi:preprotein translocase subunit SecY